MKELRLILSIVVLIGFIACEPSVQFSEPQPIDTKDLAELPNRLHGQFLSLSDSSTLNINNKLIQRIYDFDYVIHSNQLDSLTKLSGDTLFDTETNERALVKRVGDSLAIHIHHIDTLFYLNNDNVVRKFKGYYFLNVRNGEACYTVKKLQLSKGNLTISKISAKQEIDNLNEITESPQDTITPYNYTVTKKQFKEFIRNEGFSKSERFVRITK